MQVDAFAIRLRPRSNVEAADLGVRLCQSATGSVYRCYGPVVAAWLALALASFEIAPWLPGVAIWLAKPWLDRTILFALSRAAFGQPTHTGDLWTAQRRVWWSQLLSTWSLRRLSPWRSFTQPVYQLEGLRGSQLRKRVAQIRVGRITGAAGMTSVFSVAETILTLALVALGVWLAPRGYEPDLPALMLGHGSSFVSFVVSASYGAVVVFLEPLYVSAGFALYLTRRAELEAWDIEQEFRRAFAT